MKGGYEGWCPLLASRPHSPPECPPRDVSSQSHTLCFPCWSPLSPLAPCAVHTAITSFSPNSSQYPSHIIMQAADGRGPTLWGVTGMSCLASMSGYPPGTAGLQIPLVFWGLRQCPFLSAFVSSDTVCSTSFSKTFLLEKYYLL